MCGHPLLLLLLSWQYVQLYNAPSWPAINAVWVLYNELIAAVQEKNGSGHAAPAELINNTVCKYIASRITNPESFSF